MTARLVLSNLTSFALQVTVLVAAGAALARAFRIDEPRALFAYWRTLLLACLLLPFCQPWTVVIPPVLTAAPVVTPTTAMGAVPVAAPAVPGPVAWPIAELALIAVAAGIALRTLWLIVGALGLRRLRRQASPLEPLPDCVREAQARLGTCADLYVSDRVTSPITFGLWRPVVVLPPSVSSMPAHVQEAIAFHELLHVRRRDWLFEVLEEGVRAALWFHPAIWWLIGRIRLAREQVVDQSAIQLTDSRERYVESLLAVAAARSAATFTLASPFLRRHLLKQRVARILQETTMTTRRLIASFTASAVALGLAATFAVRSFPLAAQGRAPAGDGQPIQLVSGSEHLMHGDRPEYPERALKNNVEGDVVVDLTLDERGEVSDARVVSGPEELRKATLEAVLRWHYSPSAIRSTVTQATLRFKLPVRVVESIAHEAKFYATSEDGHATLRAGNVKHPEPTEVKVVALGDVELKTKHAERELKADQYEVSYDKTPVEVQLAGAIESKDMYHDKERLHAEARDTLFLKLRTLDAPPALELLEGAPPIVDVRTERVSDALAVDLLAQVGLAVGQPLTRESGKRLQDVAHAMDEHFHVEFEKVKDGIILTLIAR